MAIQESILQSYLDAQYIKTVEQSHIEYLKKVITELKKNLVKRKKKILSYTLVSLDPMITESEPVIKEIEKIIIKKWPAFKNSISATRDKSITYVRAVILEALSQMAKHDDLIAALIWHTARDVVSYYQTSKDAQIFALVLQNMANQVEIAGRREWTTDNQIDIGPFKPSEIKFDVPYSALVNNESLLEHLLAAFVHSAWISNAGGGENPRPQTHGNWEWPKFAAERSALGIADEVNSALLLQNKSITSISKSIKQNLDNYFSQLKPFLENISATYTTSIGAYNKRSELLWWKQTLCSPSLNRSYRTYKPLETALLMAIDLAQEVNPIYPLSVDFLLRETLKDVHSQEVDSEYLLNDLIDKAIKIDDSIKNLMQNYSEDIEGRKPFLTGLANAITAGNSQRFFSDTGIDKKASISISHLAIWVFHGSQAAKLAKL